MDTSRKNNLLRTVEKSWLGMLPDHFFLELALSGGMDSVVLLVLLTELRRHYPLQLSAVHVHHGLQPGADEWAQFCERLCAARNVPLRIVRVQIPPDSSLGPEGAARSERYKAFTTSAAPVIVLAQHQDDQLETFLLAMLRGGGLRSLAAMPALRSFGGKILWRPLLTVSRAELKAYAAAAGLTYVTDPTNADRRYLRNWTRHELLPFMRRRLPAIDRHLGAGISTLQRQLALFEEVAALDAAAVSLPSGAVVLEKFLSLSRPRQEAVFIFLSKKNAVGTARRAALTAFLDGLGQKPVLYRELQLEQGMVYVYAGKIWYWSSQSLLYRKLNINYFIPAEICWRALSYGLNPVILNKGWQIRPVDSKDKMLTELGEQSVLTVLKKRKVPRFLRTGWPVITTKNNQCLAIVGIKVNQNFSVKNGRVPFIPALEKYLA